jgi:hypothetical protein
LPTPPPDILWPIAVAVWYGVGKRGKLRTYLLIKEMPPSPVIRKGGKTFIQLKI